ncbi:hepatoma-derived growth factor-related protein 2-like [Cucurbita maxima]|uniref:Hepatoma-derived growth factor-related protein 2-like n=1 Tax=Cucurbita maxima TaxID=3661 RepID=A0A6J1JMQ5_CUCMA|nr:hepatoma-derived growth factor-related protein 2-like [Cucurbita maxima]
MCYIFIQPKRIAMDWFVKSSKPQDKNDTESLKITFEPILFHPDRNEYETCIKLPGCQKDQIKVTYEKATRKVKVQGKKQKTEFVQEFCAPADCLATGIYGRFCGEVLRIIMPRMLSDRSTSNDASSKQEDDQKASSDRKAAEHAEEHRDKLPARVPAPPPSDQRSADEVKEIGGEIQRRSMDKMLPAKRKWTASEDASLEKEDDQKASSDGRATAEAGEYREKSPVRAPAPSPTDPELSEKSRQRDNQLFPEISAPRPSAIEPRRSVKELRENYQKNISEIAAPPPPPPPPPPPSSRAAASTPWNRKTTGIKARKEKEEDQTPPSTGDAESEKSVLESQKNKKKTDQEVAKKAEIVTESKENEKSEEKKPSAGGNVIFQMLAKVKETGKAAVAKVKETGEAVAKVAMKEENRQAVMIGAAVLTIVVIGASLRSARKNKK